MRTLVLLLLPLLALPATAMAGPSQAIPPEMQDTVQNDPMVIPPGMQSVPVTPRDLPAGITGEVVQVMPNGQPAPAAMQVANTQQPAADTQAVPGMPAPQAQVTPQAQVMPQAQVTPQAEAAPQPAAPQAAEQLPAPTPAPQAQASAPQNLAPSAGPATPPAAAEAPAPAGPASLLHISHGITYVFGGTTQGDIDQFKALDGEFNLQLLFAAKNGDHLVSSKIRLLDYHNFELVSATNVGPYLYAHVNPGDYVLEVTTDAGAKPIKMKLKVTAKRLRKTVLLK